MKWNVDKLTILRQFVDKKMLGAKRMQESGDKLLFDVQKLFQNAGYELPELLEALKERALLLEDNRKLREEVRRLTAKIRPVSVQERMSSKLKDALRE